LNELGKSLLLVMLLASSAVITAAPGAKGSTSQGTIGNSSLREFPLPWTGAGPLGISTGQDGKVWFTENNASSIGSFDPQTGSWQDYRVPSIPPSPFPEIHAQMYGIATDAGGGIWFTSWLGDQVVRFDPRNSTFMPYVLGPQTFETGNREPTYLLVEGQTVWFSELAGYAIGRLDVWDGNVTEFRAPCACPVGGLAFVPGKIWFTIPESGVGKIGVFYPSTGKFEIFKTILFDNVQSYLEEPTGMVADSQGRIWLTDHASDTVLEFDSGAKFDNESITGYWTPPPGGGINRTEPFGVAVAQNGNVWFTEPAANRVGVIDPATERMTEYVVPTPNSVPEGIVVDKEGRVWFAELFGNKLGMIDPSVAPSFNVSITPGQVSLVQGTTSSVTITLSAPPNFNPGGPLKVWVTGVGISSQYLSYYIGNTAQLPGNQTSLQLLLHASGSLPAGRYVATFSISSPSLVQDIVVKVDVAGQTILQQLTSGYVLYLVAPGIVVASTATYLMWRRRHLKASKRM